MDSSGNIVGLIGSRTYIKDMYKINKKDFCTCECKETFQTTNILYMVAFMKW